MAHHQHNTNRGQTGGIQGLLKLFRISNSPTLELDGEDDIPGEADEPPDDRISPLHSTFNNQDSLYKRSSRQKADRRESLLTRALMGDVSPEEHSPTLTSARPAERGLSSASTHSNASMTSNADHTSDTGITTPSGSAAHSPSLHPTHHALVSKSNLTTLVDTELKPVAVGDSNEAVVEKTLGRKRCIMFACGKAPEKAREPVVEPVKEETPIPEPPKRKCMLRFACPSRETKGPDLTTEVMEETSRKTHKAPLTTSNLVASHKSSTESVISAQQKDMSTAKSVKATVPAKGIDIPDQSTTAPFHEFGSSNDEPDAWVNKPTDHQPKLTMTDCMKKENAIRQLGKEADEEAEQEEEEANEEEEDLENDDNEDDFAPSDGTSDAGNESDDEEGFADSDDESDAESDYQFWAPSKGTSITTAAASNDNLTASIIRPLNSKRPSIASSLESGPSGSLPRQLHPDRAFKHPPPRRQSLKFNKMRPSTPELPDSTDFVCGTFDEDRPLEAAYISCRELKKRQKHIPVPQDIDPSFPTTDPEDNDDDDDDDKEVAGIEEEDDHLWFRDQFDGSENDANRGRRKIPAAKKSPVPSPRRLHSPPPPKTNVQRPAVNRHNTNRSPPPKHNLRRPSPAPRRLFGHSPSRLRSPPPQKLRSPRGSPTNRPIPLGITTGRLNAVLGQRPNTGLTASLPQTPNPFFRYYNSKSTQPSRLCSGVTSPILQSEAPDYERHVRGAVDIVSGLEKKRQKRKEKFWRQHCRKATKEVIERKPAPGRGVERMKELGLVCAERTKAYGLPQPAQLVISL